jgi:hypothetical protein
MDKVPMTKSKNTRNKTLLSAVVIFTLLFPKAGLNYGGVPLTMNLLLVAIVIIGYSLSFFHKIRLYSFVIVSLMIPWYFLVSVRSNSLIESKTLRFGSIYWFLIAPIFWIVVEILVRNNRYISQKLVVNCSLLAALFGLGQYFFGLNFLKISGLTIAWGDSYDRKNLSLFESATEVGSKIPSTFQGGNIWGQCSSLILIWVIVFQIWNVYQSKIMKIVTLVAPIVGVALSLSRTALVASTLTVLLFAIGNSKYSARIFSGIFVIMTLSVFFLPTIFDRYSVSSLSNSAGRAEQWKTGLDNYSILDWLFGRSSMSPGSAFHMEGLLGLFGQVGIIGFLMMVILWFKIYPKEFKWLGICLLICLILDSTYISPPLLLIPAILMLATSVHQKTITGKNLLLE